MTISSKNDAELKQYLLYLLSKREYSRQELRQKCLKFNDDCELIEQILADFQHKNWQSDERFVEMFLYSKSNKYGNLRLKEELRQKGIVVEDYLALLPDKETQIAQAIIILNKKFKSKEQDIKAKQLRFLLYRGFSYDICYAAIEQWKQE